jgi:peptide/nickel transport system permease protein
MAGRVRSSWVLRRLLTALVTLFGCTLLTFLLLDRAPADRAALEVAQRQQDGNYADEAARVRSLQQLRLAFGQLDPDTMAPLPLWQRYGRWLRSALPCWPAAPHPDTERAWRRIAAALPTTVLLGSLALCVTLVGGIWLGLQLGTGVGGRGDRWLSPWLLVLVGTPEFLLASLCMLLFGSATLGWLPTHGLRSPGADAWSVPAQLLDVLAHLVLPVLVMASGPLVLVVRFLRDSVRRQLTAPYALQLRAFGLSEDVVQRRLLHNAAAPLATLAGSLLPMLVGGSIMVENLFAIDGLGHLAVRAVQSQDQALVLALLLLGSGAALGALLLSDLLHGWLDPRVRLEA